MNFDERTEQEITKDAEDVITPLSLVDQAFAGVLIVCLGFSLIHFAIWLW